MVAAVWLGVYGARLYSDAALQGFFFVVQIYGWWNWHRARDAKGLARIEILSGRGRLAWLAVIAAATVAEGWYLARFTPDAAPWMDANTTAMSVVAQYLLSVRKVENWVLDRDRRRADRALFLEGPLSDDRAIRRILVLSVFGPARMAPAGR